MAYCPKGGLKLDIKKWYKGQNNIYSNKKKINIVLGQFSADTKARN